MAWAGHSLSEWAKTGLVSNLARSVPVDGRVGSVGLGPCVPPVAHQGYGAQAWADQARGWGASSVTVLLQYATVTDGRLE